MSISREVLQSLMMISGLGIMCWIMLRKRWRTFKRTEPLVVNSQLGHNANSRIQPNQFSGVQSLGAPNEVLKWQVELHDLARELKAELDSKMIAVRTVTRQYEQAARRLNDMIKIAENVGSDAHVSDLTVEQSRQEYQKDAALALSNSGWSDQRIADSLSLPVAVVRELLS